MILHGKDGSYWFVHPDHHTVVVLKPSAAEGAEQPKPPRKPRVTPRRELF